MRYAMLCLITVCVLGASFLGNAKSQPGQFSDPLADDVKALKAEVKSQGDRLAALEAVAANLPYRNSDPAPQAPARPAPLVSTVPAGYTTVCDDSGCRVVASGGGLFRPPFVTYYQPAVSYTAFSGGGGCAGGQCGVSVSYRRRR